ncbi:hypothetical protein BJI47_12360 [Rhodococcus sp. 1168]|nr:hypothetical protein BJI47_12360 [Rhodococcus sp. 1168]
MVQACSFGQSEFTAFAAVGVAILGQTSAQAVVTDPYVLATALIGLDNSITSRHSSPLNSAKNDRRDLLMLV